MRYTDFAGVIFDVDDTLLDNKPPGTTMGLHEYSRLLTAHEIGKRRGNLNLQKFTARQCAQAFEDAPEHSLRGAVWQMLVMAGEVTDGEVQPDHPLLIEMMIRKDELHEGVLRTKGREVSGATRFVKALAANGLEHKLAIASTACRRDIDIFLGMTDLIRFFPDARIIAREQLTHAKPHPQAFNLAFATLGLPEGTRTQVVAFEDDPRGIMSAKAAGLYTCAITTRFTKKDLAKLAVPPDLIADSYAEFARLFDLPFTPAAPVV